MTDREILQFLVDTGHMYHPFGTGGFASKNLNGMTIHSSVVKTAIRSWQDFMAPTIETLAMKCHGRPARADGELGPAGLELMGMPRCGCADYGPDVQPAIGTGNFKGCHGIGNFHAAKVFIDDEDMPSFLRPVFDEVWKRVVAAFDQIGMHFIRVDEKQGANIYFSFETGRTGWIGLAIRTLGLSCGSKAIWCKYSARYHPSNVVAMWVRLILHELLHNLGLSHIRTGIMAPVLTGGPASLINDPILELVIKLYGGVPIPGGLSGEGFWSEQGFRSPDGEEVWIPLFPWIAKTEGREEIYRLNQDRGAP